MPKQQAERTTKPRIPRSILPLAAVIVVASVIPLTASRGRKRAPQRLLEPLITERHAGMLRALARTPRRTSDDAGRLANPLVIGIVAAVARALAMSIDQQRSMSIPAE